jgi:hypothetical protein
VWLEKSYTLTELQKCLTICKHARMCNAVQRVYVPDIQGDSGGICNTLRNDSMCDSKQKISYERGSDFERLPGYGK